MIPKLRKIYVKLPQTAIRRSPNAEAGPIPPDANENCHVPGSRGAPNLRLILAAGGPAPPGATKQAKTSARADKRQVKLAKTPAKATERRL